MDEESYQEGVRKLRIGGLRYVADFAEVDALEAAAEARRDIPTLVIIDTMMERHDGFVRYLDALTDPVKLDELLEKLARFGPFDDLWHILFTLVERDPALLPRVEAAIAGWPDEDRNMPIAWWDRMLAGERQEYFRLARNSGIKGRRLNAAAIRRHAPCFQWLTELSLEGSKLDAKSLEQFVSLPDIRRLRRLSLAFTGLQERHVAILTGTTNLAGLEWLDLSANEIGEAGAAAIICEGAFENLGVLNLSEISLTFGALADALAGASPRTRPIRLCLNTMGEHPDPEGFAAFVRSEAFRGIGGLNLAFYKMTPGEAAELAHSPSATAFRHLEINESTLGVEGMKAILSSHWIKNADHLELRNQHAGDGIAPHLSSLSGGAIQMLNLLHNDLGPATGQVLGSIDLTHLRQLHLSYNPLGDHGAAAILANKTLMNLEDVQMQDVGAGAATARAIVENTNLRGLKTLWLGDRIGGGSARLLAEAPHLASLKAAHLGGVPDTEQERLRNSRYLRETCVTTYETRHRR
jgi:hypothetical protein